MLVLFSHFGYNEINIHIHTAGGKFSSEYADNKGSVGNVCFYLCLIINYRRVSERYLTTER